MKKILLVLGIVIALTITYSLLVWGCGSLFVYAFNIPYEWTFLKSLSIVLVLALFTPCQLRGEINLDKSRTNQNNE